MNTRCVLMLMYQTKLHHSPIKNWLTAELILLNSFPNLKWTIKASPNQLFFCTQGQPHLLDPHLEELLSILLAYIKDNGAPCNKESYYKESKAPCGQVTSQAFKYVYLLTKVRGYKRVVNKLPHEVNNSLIYVTVLPVPWKTSSML